MACTSIRFQAGSDGECLSLNKCFSRNLLPTRLEAKLCAAAQPYKGKVKPLPNKLTDNAPKGPQARRYSQGTAIMMKKTSGILIELAFGVKTPTASDQAMQKYDTCSDLCKINKHSQRKSTRHR
jgi:hypothetical protein